MAWPSCAFTQYRRRLKRSPRSLGSSSLVPVVPYGEYLQGLLASARHCRGRVALGPAEQGGCRGGNEGVEALQRIGFIDAHDAEAHLAALVVAGCDGGA